MPIGVAPGVSVTDTGVSSHLERVLLLGVSAASNFFGVSSQLETDLSGVSLSHRLLFETGVALSELEARSGVSSHLLLFAGVSAFESGL